MLYCHKRLFSVNGCFRQTALLNKLLCLINGSFRLQDGTPRAEALLDDEESSDVDSAEEERRDNDRFGTDKPQKVTNLSHRK